MKNKLIITLIFSMVLVSISKSQEVRYGIIAGLDLAKIRTVKAVDVMAEYDPMISYNINGYLGYKSTGIFGISMEPGFIQKGGTALDSRYKYNYLQLPILGELYVTDKLFLSIGPELSYLLNVKINSTNANGLIDRRSELSGIAGINYGVTNKIDVGITYCHGLTYTSKTYFTGRWNEYLGEAKEYNQYMQLKVRYKI